VSSSIDDIAPVITGKLAIHHRRLVGRRQPPSVTSPLALPSALPVSWLPMHP